MKNELVNLAENFNSYICNMNKLQFMVHRYILLVQKR